jgi:hypothetical protein
MFPVARKHNLLISELPDEVLVYDRLADKAHCLNASVALVWRHCKGEASVADLARLVAERQSIHEMLALAVVDLALEQLSKRNLLVEPLPPAPRTNRLTRRDALKGLAVAAAIPVIMTVAARKAAAQFSLVSVSCNVSGVNAPDGAPCLVGGLVPGGNCCSGVCVNPLTDPNNCGSCGNVCLSGAGEVCINGQCRIPS